MDNNCWNQGCRGKIRPATSEKDVCNTFSYLYTLFDPKGQFVKKTSNAKNIEQKKLNPQVLQQKNLCEFIDHVRKENAYDKVELKPIFTFMDTFQY